MCLKGGRSLCMYLGDPDILPVPPEVPEMAGLMGPGAEGAEIDGPDVSSVAGGGVWGHMLRLCYIASFLFAC